MGPQGLWDWEQRQQKLAEPKNCLTPLDTLLPWEPLRPLFQKVHERPRQSKAGGKPLAEF